MSQAALSEPARDWLYIAKRLPQVVWAALVGTMRNAAPSLLMAGSICGAHLMGLYSADPWWLLLPIIFGAFAIGIAQDRAEYRAASDWAGKFWKLIETDHILEISVTHQRNKETVNIPE